MSVYANSIYNIKYRDIGILSYDSVLQSINEQ